MAVVNTNTAASISQAALARNERSLAKAMEQLSTGQKINTAGDNAAGLAISTRMTFKSAAWTSLSRMRMTQSVW